LEKNKKQIVNYSSDKLVKYYQKKVKYQKTRKREYIDPRDYIVAILHYEFGYTEEDLGFLCKVHHSTINHCKKNPHNCLLYNDSKFLKNTEEVRKLFPYTFTNPELIDSQTNRRLNIKIYLTKEEYGLFKQIAGARGKHINKVTKEFAIAGVNKYIIDRKL
jgi:hypothetical protein